MASSDEIVLPFIVFLGGTMTLVSSLFRSVSHINGCSSTLFMAQPFSQDFIHGCTLIHEKRYAHIE